MTAPQSKKPETGAVREYVLRPPPGAPYRNFSIDYAAELNEGQLKAVRALEGPYLVIAGAGSGKTRTLIYRVAHLIECGIDPSSILLLTFTRKAAQEMMRRAALLLDERCRSIRGGTFHGFANLTLRRFAHLIGYERSFTIIDRGDAEDVLAIVRSELGLAERDKRFPTKRTLLQIISKSINTGRQIEDIVADEYPQFYEEQSQIVQVSDNYQIYKQQRSLMDYDDLLVNLKLLLAENPEVRQKLSAESRYIMIDEFQDTNTIQADIAALLASSHGNIMAVGDDSQSIYAFRGANFRNIMDFPEKFEGCTIIRMEQNYRSTRPILAFTNAVIASAEEKYEKSLFSDIPSPQKPVFLRVSNFEDQAAFVCQRVLELREEGVELQRMAVLFRAGFHSNELEIELNSRNIPFAKFGGLKFVEAAHVKDVVSLIRVVQNPGDVVSWNRQLLLLEGIGAKTARNVIEAVAQGGPDALLQKPFAAKKYGPQLKTLHQALLDLQSEDSPAGALRCAAEYYAPLLRQNYDDYKKRVDDVESLIRIASRYADLQRFLDDISLEPPEQSQVGVRPEDGEDEKLVLSTIHSAKGLEWHTVFVISLIDGYLPSSRSMQTTAELEEERRLLYVACTRAEKNLYLLSPELSRTRGFSPISPGFAFSDPSRFLSEILDFDELTESWSLTGTSVW